MALLVLCVAVVGMLIFAKGEDVDDEPGRRITLPPLGGIADYQIGGAYPPNRLLQVEVPSDARRVRPNPGRSHAPSPKMSCRGCGLYIAQPRRE